MKLTNLLWTTLLQKGFEIGGKNWDAEFTIPQEDSDGNPKEPIKVLIKAENMSIQIEKD